MANNSGAHAKNQGLTLIELLIAITIFAIMTVSMFIAFDNVQKAKDITDRASARLKDYQVAFNRIGQDMLQITPRPTRDEYGDPKGALSYTSDGPLEFTRTGWTRSRFFTKNQRSELQRVQYYLEDGKLVRAYWRTLDLAPGQQPERTVLLDGVSEFSVKLLYDDKTNASNVEYNKLVDTWPPDNVKPVSQPATSFLPDKSYTMLPKAIDLILVTDDLGKIDRSYLVAHGADEVFQ